jgi:hypothetical protein
VLPGQTAAEISAQVDLETKTVKELINLEIWDHKVSAFSPMFGQFWVFTCCGANIRVPFPENEVLLYCRDI